MKDPYSGKAGSFRIDPDAGIRIPAEHWDEYQAGAWEPPAPIDDTPEEPPAPPEEPPAE